MHLRVQNQAPFILSPIHPVAEAGIHTLGLWGWMTPDPGRIRSTRQIVIAQGRRALNARQGHTGRVKNQGL